MKRYSIVDECPNCEHAPECPHYDAAGRVPLNVDCPKRVKADYAGRDPRSVKRLARPRLDRWLLFIGAVVGLAFLGFTFYEWIEGAK